MKKVLLVADSVLLVCTSCVTKKKYLLAENGRLEAIARGDDLQNQLVNCRDNNDGLTSRLASLERDTTRMGKNIRNYQSMLNTNMTEQEKLNSLLSQKMNELNERERTINELQDIINMLINWKDSIMTGNIAMQMRVLPSIRIFQAGNTLLR